MDKEKLEKRIMEAKTTEELAEIRSEIEASKVETKTAEEKPEKKEKTIDTIEERSLISQNNEVEKRDFVKVNNIKEDKMEEKRTLDTVLASKEYRTAWAKKLMGRTDFTKEESRALNDAITTTSTEFVESTASTQGQNNGGLFIPTDVRLDMLRIIDETSPFLRDVRKLAVAGNIEFPYLDASSDAEWYAELEETKNGDEEYKTLSLYGYELAKQVVITWKLEVMAVEEFIKFITETLAVKVGRAKATAIIYGNGNKKPTGALYNLTAVFGKDPIAAMIANYKNLSSEMRIGAKTYISASVATDIVGYQDNNGNYPYLTGLKKTALFDIEMDPFLVDGDILTGNPLNYILNTVEQVSIHREAKVTQRKNIYSAYGIYDGKPYPGAFSLANVGTAPTKPETSTTPTNPSA